MKPWQLGELNQHSNFVICPSAAIGRQQTRGNDLTSNSVLSQLMGVIQNRRGNPSPKSYTASLFDGGVSKIGKKIVEEAAELVEAAAAPASDERQKHITHEAADLMYHMLVMLSHCDLDLTDVEAELASRFGVSGIEEKANRQTDNQESSE